VALEHALRGNRGMGGGAQKRAVRPVTIAVSWPTVHGTAMREDDFLQSSVAGADKQT